VRARFLEFASSSLDRSIQLYELSESQQKNIRELGKARTVSEYFDRLEEYGGFEDIQAEE
jgi:hypothetical protein